MVISAVGTPPSAAAVTVTSAGSGCADVNSRSSRRCSLTSVPAGKADCRRTASRFSRCSVLTEDLPSVGLVWQRPGSPAHVNPLLKFPCRQAGHCQACRQADEEASPDHDDSHDRHRRPNRPWTGVNVLVPARFAVALHCAATRAGESAPGQTGGTARTPCSPAYWTETLVREITGTR